MACHRTDLVPVSSLWRGAGTRNPLTEAEKSLLLGSSEALGSVLAPTSVHLGKLASLVGWAWRLWFGDVGETEDLRGADLFMKLGCFGRSRKEDVIIITLQNL